MQHSTATSIEALVRSASRRWHALLALEQCRLALTIVLAGAILLLLLGTQILDWYWLVLLAVAGVAVGAFRFRRQQLSPYRIAQILDNRLKLSDILSSAWFVLETPGPWGPTRQLQLRQAEAAAKSVRPQTAFQSQKFRAWAPNALLFLVFLTLFGIRYLSYDQLSFRKALLPIHLGHAVKTEVPKLQTNASPMHKSGVDKKPDSPPMTATSPLHDNSSDETGSTMPGEKNQLEQQAISPREAAQPNGQSDPNAPKNQQPQQPPAADMSSLNDSPSQPSSSQNNSQSSPSATSPSDKNHQQASKDASSEEQSLTSKLRDVLSGLLAKMQEGASQQRGDAGGKKSHSANQDQSANGTNQSDQSSSSHSDTKEAQASSLQSQQPPQNAQMSSNSPSKGSGNAAGHRSSDGRSAAGRQDGSKDSKEAEELRAMGKLEEIMGKRSASLTGEMTVDSPSGVQQLRTGYTNKTGTHSGIGSEIDHDNIPVEDQQYVREYMKRVHNQPVTR